MTKTAQNAKIVLLVLAIAAGLALRSGDGDRLARDCDRTCDPAAVERS